MLGSACLAAGLGNLQAQAPSATPPQDEPHFFGVFSNDRTVQHRGNVKPLSAVDKWKMGTAETFDPITSLSLFASAGISQADREYPSWGQGAEGFARYYGAAFADHAASDYLTVTVFPILLHEDPRYFRMGHGSVLRRIGYAVSRVAVTRTDAGTNGINRSEFLGNASAAAVSNLYVPPSDRTAGDSAVKFATFMASDALCDVLKEFWPDVRHKLFHK